MAKVHREIYRILFVCVLKYMYSVSLWDAVGLHLWIYYKLRMSVMGNYLNLLRVYGGFLIIEGVAEWKCRKEIILWTMGN